VPVGAKRKSRYRGPVKCLPNLPCAIHVSDSEVYPVELLRRSTRRDSTGAYFTGVELSFGCYSIGVKSFVLYLTGILSKT